MKKQNKKGSLIFVFALIVFFLNHEYKQCLDLYLNEDSEIKDKRESFFPFINMTLIKLKTQKGQDQQVFYDFKTAVMNNLIRIGEINIDELHEIDDTITDSYKKFKKQISSYKCNKR